MGVLIPTEKRRGSAFAPFQPAPDIVHQLSVVALGLKIGSRAILSDVSLDVARGEIVGLLGRDGSGKTSCFEAIAGLRRVHTGRICLNGVDVTDRPIEVRSRLGLSYLCEDVSIFRSLSVEQNVELALETIEPRGSERSKHVDAILQSFQIEHVRKQLATSLSGGERRRCEIARAVARDPTIVLLDEPFRGLDPMSIGEVKQAVLRLKQGGAGVLISDYNVKSMLDVMDRVYVLHEGEVIFAGRAKSMMNSAVVRHMYLGEGPSL